MMHTETRQRNISHRAASTTSNMIKACVKTAVPLLILSASLAIQPPALAQSSPLSQIHHVFVIMMENHNWSTITPAVAPYIWNNLLPAGSHANDYHNVPTSSVLHPSEPNYLLLEGGTNAYPDHTFTDDSNPSSTVSTSSTQHLVTQLSSNGLTWKSYQEDMVAGTCPITPAGAFAPKHDPFLFFQDVSGNPPASTTPYCIAHHSALTATILQNDANTNNFANYNLLTPNLNDDMHDGTITAADTWLSTIVPIILNSSQYKQDGALFITWDEGNDGLNNPIGMIIMSPFAKVNYSNAIEYSHYSTLKTMEDIFGLTPLVGHAADASTTDLSDFFTTNPHLDTIGIYRNGQFYLRLSNTTGDSDINVAFNPPGNNLPIVGDWASTGFDAVGVYDTGSGVFTLCNTNDSTACANSANLIYLTLGNPNDTPISGRWTNSATHAGAGVYRPTNGILYVKNDLSTGFSDHAMVLGNPGDMGVAGDWTGKGYDSPGVYRPTQTEFYLLNTVSDGIVNSDLSFVYGNSTDLPIAGDWVAQGHDGAGMFRPSNGYAYLRNTTTTGVSDNAFYYGAAGDQPVAGHWQVNYPSPQAVTPQARGAVKTPNPANGGSVQGGNQIGG